MISNELHRHGVRTMAKTFGVLRQANSIMYVFEASAFPPALELLPPSRCQKFHSPPLAPAFAAAALKEGGKESHVYKRGE